MDSERENIRKVLRALVISFPTPYYELETLTRDYAARESDCIPYLRFGFKSLAAFLESFPDFKLFEMGDKQFVNCARIKQEKIQPTKRESQSITKNPFPFYYTELDEALLFEKQSSNSYEMENPHNSNMSENKYLRFTEKFAQAIPDFILMEDVERLETNFSWTGRLPKYSLEDVKVGKTMQILITEVYSPSEIWFNIYDENHAQKFLGMLEEMDQYYRKLFQKRQMAVVNQKVQGRACVVFYEGAFRRALIRGYIRRSEVRVFLADYGTFADVSVKKVAFLVDEYAKLPAQAVQGKLSHVKPTFDDYWSDFVNQHLGADIYDQCLHAKVTRIEEDTQALHLILIDEKAGDFISINKKLISLGYAEFDDSQERLAVTPSPQSN